MNTETTRLAQREQSDQYLTFRLGTEEYGIEILRVQEIRGYSAITAIPGTPRHVKGVMNLRGTVVPVIDLRARFGMPETEYDKFTVIIVVNVSSKILGIVVDAVSDVLNIAAAEISPAPEFGQDVSTTFLSGMAKNDGRLIALLEIERIAGTATELQLAGAA